MARHLLRRAEVVARTGRSASALDLDMRAGRFPRPVSLGPRSVGWPSDEVDAVISARIAGDSDEEIRALVRKLTADRKRSRE